MPVKKRTDQSKRTSSTSPTTSTSHASADHHHRLRHTGPSVSTHSGANTGPPKHARSHLDSAPEIEPTPRTSGDKKLLPDVPPTGSRTSLTKFLYALCFLVLLLFGWYLYGVISLLGKLKEEVGWWGVVTGDYSERMARWEPFGSSGIGMDWPLRQSRCAGTEKGGELEGSLNALADALGISPAQVASAVKPLIPHERLRKILSRAEETGASEALRILLEDTKQDDKGDSQITEEFAERARRENAEGVAG